MKSVNIREFGGAQNLEIIETYMPEPAENEVRIRVHYAGINRPDIMQREGTYPAPKGASPILGLECSGRIDAIGKNVKKWSLGEEVLALLVGGGYAEYVCVYADHVLPLPQGISLEQAGGVAETFFTVWSNVFDRAGLKTGEKFLVHGGASGIGVAAIQMARSLGANVWATAGTEAKCKACQDLGAAAINYNEADFVEMLKESGVRMDVILDMVGGDYIAKNMSVMNTEGRIVNIAYQKGSKAEVNFLPVMLKRLSIMGSTLRVRSNADKAKIAARLYEHIWPQIESGEIRPIIDRVFPLEDVAAAHAYLENGDHIGKVLLRIRP